MTPAPRPAKGTSRLFFLAAGGGVLALAVALLISAFGAQLSALAALLTDKEAFKTWVASWGAWGPAVYILIQAGQVILAPLPGETTAGLVSGLVFGFGWGLCYSMVGLTLGSAVAFGLGRLLGESVARRWIAPETRDRYRHLLDHQGAWLALLLFAVPYVPKDSLCILLGMGGMDFRVFLPVVVLGRLPAVALFTWKGAALYAGDYLMLGVAAAFFLGLAAVMYLQRQRLWDWLNRPR